MVSEYTTRLYAKASSDEVAMTAAACWRNTRGCVDAERRARPTEERPGTSVRGGARPALLTLTRALRAAAAALRPQDGRCTVGCGARES